LESQLDSTGSSEPSAFPKTAIRAAAEGAVVALIGALVAGRIWTASPERQGIVIGVAAAWAASTVSIAWLLWATGRSMEIFWRAFGGGMLLRAVVLLALAVCTYGRPGTSFEAVLLSYVFALLALMLTLEMRHFKIQ
jgi:hypothetical protein